MPALKSFADGKSSVKFGVYPMEGPGYNQPMLSYRHAYHAGNHADILKHSILTFIVQYLAQKDKPFSYLDTHAGAGIYSLDADSAKLTGEAERGILAWLDANDVPTFFAPYLELCRSYYRSGHRYPGSPELVRALSRADDRLVLMELHPTEIDNLRFNLGGDPRVAIHHRDGYSGLLALTPPEPRRGLALIDPSYETADDYEKTAESLLAAHRRWPVGILALWYPIVPRRQTELALLKERLASSGIDGILAAEYEFSQSAPNAEGYGLTGSGMLIVQPPWPLAASLETALPSLGGTQSITWLSDPK